MKLSSFKTNCQGYKVFVESTSLLDHFNESLINCEKESFEFSYGIEHHFGKHDDSGKIGISLNEDSTLTVSAKLFVRSNSGV